MTYDTIVNTTTGLNDNHYHPSTINVIENNEIKDQAMRKMREENSTIGNEFLMICFIEFPLSLMPCIISKQLSSYCNYWNRFCKFNDYQLSSSSSNTNMNTDTNPYPRTQIHSSNL